MMDLKKLGQLLREKREEIGIPPSTLAKRAGIGRTTLWMLEQGENPQTGKPSRPRKAILLKVADVLKVSPGEKEVWLELAGYEEEKAQEAPSLHMESLIQEDIKPFEYRPIFYPTVMPEEIWQKHVAPMLEAEYPALYLDHFWSIQGVSRAFEEFLHDITVEPVNLVGRHFFEVLFWQPMQEALNRDSERKWEVLLIPLLRVFDEIRVKTMQEAPELLRKYDDVFRRIPNFDNLLLFTRQTVQGRILPESFTGAVAICSVVVSKKELSPKTPAPLHQSDGPEEMVEKTIGYEYACLLHPGVETLPSYTFVYLPIARREMVFEVIQKTRRLVW